MINFGGGVKDVVRKMGMHSEIHPEGATIMAKHLNPLEKEFLIRRYKSSRWTTKEFAAMNDITEQSLKKWLRQYEEGGLEGLARADALSKASSLMASTELRSHINGRYSSSVSRMNG